MFLKRICLMLVLGATAPLTAADDLSWLDVYLAQPILQPHQTLVETQIHLASRVKPIPAIASTAQWEQYAQQLRTHILDNVVFRGEAAKWRDMPTQVTWLDTLAGDGYRVKKFRYEVIPGMWLPGLLYEPAQLTGRVPVVLNLNGHEGEGKANSYIQERCLNLAKKGLLAYNYEWFGMGELAAAGYSHARLNQIDLTGTSGLAPFFLAQKRLVDIALQHPNADADRLAVTGLSGGGWQTILLSSLDRRVKLAMPVAGYSSFVTRTQFPEMDLGDSEQTPVDLGQFADYTHLTAMLAPRPLQIAHNARDNCCFRADYALAPLLVAAGPIFALYGDAARLRSHTNFDAGHNYGLENREALYRFLKESFYAGGAEFSAEEIPSAAEVRTAEQLRVPLPAGNEDLHTVALKLSQKTVRGQPPSRAPSRETLREVVRWTDYRATAHQVSTRNAGGIAITSTRLSLDNTWTVPLLDLSPAASTGTTLVLADSGKATLTNEIQQLLDRKRRVVTIDPFYFGESRLETRDYLFALLASSLGERPLGIQAGQVAAAARWLRPQYGPVSLAAYGPRTSLIALVAAAMETDAISDVKLVRPLASLREVIERDMTVVEAPELFCFGLLEAFDIPQLSDLVKPRPLVR
ncbi:MAG TPA: acetylxylan esterase [Candidatus Acidoferrales bacterium]|jgi:dienelactone hydrolase|nr:acetylxylan esterase [Candidatus Acidoferrales bacterium]